MNATEQSEISRYVDQVRAALADLPPSVRDDLLDDLPDHLAEVAAESEGTLEERLGPPAAYAAELRATAGIGASRWRRGARVTAASARVQAAARSLDDRVGRLLGYERARDFGRLLRPGWWVLRGYLAAMLFLALFVGGPFGGLPAMKEHTVIWLIATAVGIVASVRLGKIAPRLSRRPARLLMVGNALLVVALLVGIANQTNQAPAADPAGSYGTPYDGVIIFPYDRDGKPLRDVRLVDQYGQEVHVGDGHYCDEPYLEDSPTAVYPPCGRSHPYPSLNPLPRPTATPTPTPSPSPGG